jgi:hypothetical protein
MFTHQIHKGKVAILVLALLALAFSYDYVTHNVLAQDAASAPKNGAAGVIADGIESESVIDKASMALLERIESISFNKAVLTDPAFLSLEDRTVELTPEPAGRSNPFAPLGSAQAPVTTKTPARR